MAPITLTEPASPRVGQDTSDAEFLQQIQWNANADSSLRRAAEAGEELAVWAALTKQHFGLGPRANRKKVQERRYAAGMSLWSRSVVTESDAETRLAEIWSSLAGRIQSAQQEALSHQTHKKKQPSSKNGQAKAAVKVPRKLLAALTEYSETTAGQPPSAWELVLLCDVLRQTGNALPAKAGLPLWRRALMAASEWGSQMEANIDTADPASLMRAGELPWVLGLLFAHVSGAETLRKRGREVLHTALEEHTDTDGTLRAQEMEHLAAWLPPLVRATEWGYAAEDALWNTSSGRRFQALLNRVSACCAGDGHLAFDQPDNPHTLPMLLTAARAAGGSKKEWPLRFLLDVAETQPELLGQSGGRKHSAKLKTARRRTVETDADSLVQQSDWARFACLRNHGGRDADVFAVTHHHALPKIDFSILGHGILRGDWELEVSFNGKPLKLPEEWTCVCWHTDSDGDYLELQHTIDENRRIERQVFLARNDHFLVMADCISGAGEAKIDYTSRLPLVDYAEFVKHSATRERIVRLAEVRMRTFPLALPEDIVHSTAGSWGLSETSETPCLELKQTGIGGVYAPVVFDWTPARQNSDADWRTLTVTENGPKVKGDRASGHRLRIGNQQLLLYRSLVASDDLRTVLGHHTGNETVIARFNKNGDVSPLLIVE